MISTQNIYIGLMILAGLAAGVMVLRDPSLQQAAISPIFGLLIASFVIEVGILFMGRNMGLKPVAMGERFVGFAAGAVLYLVVVNLLKDRFAS